MTAMLRAVGSQVLVAAIAAVLAMALLVLSGERGPKLMILVVGMILFGVGAALSGNVRLFFLWGFVLTMPFDLSYRVGTIYPKLGGETAFRVELSDFFWLPLLAYLIRDLAAGALKGIRIPKVTFVWLAIMAMGAVAIVTGPWRMTAAHEVVRMLKVMVMFVVLVNELRSPGRMLHVALALAVAVLIQSSAGIVQFVTGSAFGLTKLGEADVTSATNVVRGGAVTRIGAFMIHPVIFATFLATLLPIALGMLLIRGDRLRRSVFACAILLGLPALILTLSRAGWLTFAISSTVLAALVMFRPRLRTKAVLPLLGAGIVMGIVAIGFGDRIMARVYKSHDESQRGRDEWAQDAKRMIDAKPLFGFGLNSYAFAAPPYTRLGERGAREFYEKARAAGTPLMPVVHNAYLQWMVEIGIFGMLLHLTIFAMMLRMAWRNLRVHDEQLFVLNAACLAGLLGYLADLGFGNSLRQGSTLREFFLLSALVCAIHYWRLRNEVPAPARAPALPALPPGAQPATR
jgi:O-antigen ligase